MQITRDAWLEIDLDKLVSNINKIKANISSKTFIISVVKYNAYSLGANEIVERLIEEGINYFAVATMTEAIALRRRFSSINILVLGRCEAYNYEEAIKNDIRLTIFNVDEAKDLNNHAKQLNKDAQIHIALDTGMHRIGFACNEDSIKAIEKIYKLSNIDIEGIFSHFPAADTDPEYTKMQFEKFIKMNDELKNININIPIKHISNSQGILHFKKYNLDAVRPGIIQYGSSEGYPSEYDDFNVEFIAELKARISNIQMIKAGTKVGYGLTFTAEKDMKIATIPIGYADGILRQLSGKIDVLISGKRCRQIGSICMDQAMVDVSDVDCKLNDEVVIIGRQGNEHIDIMELSDKAGEVATSFVCHFSNRLPRVYIKNKKEYKLVDNILNYEKIFE